MGEGKKLLLVFWAHPGVQHQEGRYQLVSQWSFITHTADRDTSDMETSRESGGVAGLKSSSLPSPCRRCWGTLSLKWLIYDSPDAKKIQSELIPKIVLAFMKSACFIWVIKACSWKKKSLRSLWFEAAFVCLFVPPPPINHDMGGGGFRQQTIKQWCNQTSFFFSPRWLTKRTCPRWVDSEPIAVYWFKPSLMYPSRISVIPRPVKESFDFWDVCGRAGPASNLPLIWLQYQTISPQSYKVSDSSLTPLLQTGCNQNHFLFFMLR